jgi:hypothetical protein
MNIIQVDATYVNFVGEFFEVSRRLAQEGVVDITPDGPKLRIAIEDAVKRANNPRTSVAEQKVLRWILWRNLDAGVDEAVSALKKEGVLQDEPEARLNVSLSAALTRVLDTSRPFLHRLALTSALADALWETGYSETGGQLFYYLHMKLVGSVNPEEDRRFLLQAFGTEDSLAIEHRLQKWLNSLDNAKSEGKPQLTPQNTLSARG